MKTPQVPRWMRNLMMGIIAMIWISPNEAQAENAVGVSFQVFYDELMPYGDWVKDGRHGYVWLPAVYEDFHPYGTNGHWVNTSYGNTWVSDYDWGWATFHYGRWYFDDNYQSWAWVPDYDWGPAWVDWRSGGGYYGWAPMGPGFSVSVRVNIPTAYWVFVPQNRFVYHNVYSYNLPRSRRVKIYNNTTIINNTVVYNNNHYYAGPARREVEKVTRRSYPERRIENSRTAGRTVASRNSVSAYRPDLQTARGTTTAARPSRVLTSGDARRQPAATPSRVNSRTESVSGRSATAPARTTRSTERAKTPSRTENSGVRSATPSSRGSFETKPSSSTQTRTATPSRQSQTAPSNSRSNESRSANPTVRTETTRKSQPKSPPTRTQRATPTQRSTPARTQPAQSRTQSPSPAAKTSPARSTQTRQSAPASSRSTVKSAPARSATPASTSRSSSSNSSSKSRSSSRGNK